MVAGEVMGQAAAPYQRFGVAMARLAARIAPRTGVVRLDSRAASEVGRRVTPVRRSHMARRESATQIHYRAPSRDRSNSEIADSPHPFDCHCDPIDRRIA